MRRQLSSQISSAVTEVEIGAEDLEDVDVDVDIHFFLNIFSPAGIEHVEEEKACAK